MKKLKKKSSELHFMIHVYWNMVVDINKSNECTIDSVQLMLDRAVEDKNNDMVNFIKLNFPKYQNRIDKFLIFLCGYNRRIRNAINNTMLTDLKNNNIDNTKFIFEHSKHLSWNGKRRLTHKQLLQFNDLSLFLLFVNNNYLTDNHDISEIMYHQLNLTIIKNNYEEIENCFDMCYDKFTQHKSWLGVNLIIKCIIDNNFVMCDIILNKIENRLFITELLLTCIHEKYHEINLNNHIIKTLSRICQMVNQNKISNNNNYCKFYKNCSKKKVIQYFCDYIPEYDV